MQTCYSISDDFQTDNQGLSNSCPPSSKVPSIMRGIGSRVKGHTSVKQNAGEPVRKPTPNRSVLTPSPLTRSGKLNLNNIFPRDAVLLKDSSQGLLAWGIPPAKTVFYINCQNFCPICGNESVTPDLIRGPVPRPAGWIPAFAGMTEKTVGMAASSLWKCGGEVFFGQFFVTE
jgi:hypothetical protein